MSADTLLRAQEALDTARADPRRAVAMAQLTSTMAEESGDLHAASVSERALGLAAMQVEDLDRAAEHLRASIRLARRAGLPTLAAQSRVSLAGALSQQGRAGRALHEIDAALPDLPAAARPRAVAQRAAVCWQLGRQDEALRHYRAALREMRRSGDLVGVQRVLGNRAVLLIQAGSLAAADRDLHEAERICVELELGLPAANVQENLVLLYRRRGDVPAALRHLDAAERLYARLAVPTGSLRVERSELLLSVGLLDEAREAAEQAVTALERANNLLDMPQARLLLARAARLTGQPEQGLREARLAAAEFRRQNRAEWATLARLSILLNGLAGKDRPRLSMGVLRRAILEAEACGWLGTAAEARLEAGAKGLGGRSDAAAETLLRELAARRRRGPAVRRAQGWLAEAMVRRHRGRSRAAAAAARAGLRILDEHRATMSATDLRAHVAGLGSDLSRLGLATALETGSVQQVLSWAEAGRARHLVERPATPPADAEMSQMLGELRSVVAEVEQLRRSSQPAAAPEGRQVQLERAIRDRTRVQRRAEPGASAAREPGVGPDVGQRAAWGVPATSLGAHLGGAALVEFVLHDDDLYAVTVTAHARRLTPLGPVAAARDLIRWLPFGLRRLSRAHAAPESRDAALALLRDVAGRLDALLLGPLHRQLGDRDLVVVPTGELQSLPWSLLPSLTGRPVTVSPSAALWLAAATRSRPGLPGGAGPTVVVAGPGLPGAEHEARQVAAIYDVTPVLDDQATAQGVLGALAGASVAHLATHGRLRADNALFSSLQLYDGPLTVYDLEVLPATPDTVVLAACDSGRSIVLAGDELLGLGAAFLSRDTRHLVASVVPVPDAETAPLMVAFHRLLRTGLPVARALADAQQATATGAPAAAAAAAGFVCLGDGLSPASTPRS